MSDNIIVWLDNCNVSTAIGLQLIYRGDENSWAHDKLAMRLKSTLLYNH